MARKQNDDLLIEDELAAAFLNDDNRFWVQLVKEAGVKAD